MKEQFGKRAKSNLKTKLEEIKMNKKVKDQISLREENWWDA